MSVEGYRKASRVDWGWQLTTSAMVSGVVARLDLKVMPAFNQR